MNIEKHLILVKGEDKTEEINHCMYENGKWQIEFATGKTYSYNQPNVQWLKNPVSLLGATTVVYQNNQPYYTVFGKGLDDLGNRFPSIKAAIFWAIDDPLLYGELMSLLDYQYVNIDFVDKSLAELGNDSPLDLYCSYTSD